MERIGCFVGVLVLVLPSLWAQGSEEPVQVWAMPSLEKVRPDDNPQKANLVWNGASREVRLAGAANEHVPFQLVVSTPPPPNRYIAAASGFRVEVSELTGQRGTIGRESIGLFLEHVILVYGKSSPVGGTGFWPDALAPLTGTFDMSAQFRQAVRNRGVWVDVFVPEGTPAGDYRGTIEVSRNGTSLDQITISLHVYDFTLPRETHLLTYMGVSEQGMAAAHDTRPGTAESRELLKQYHRFLYEHRMEPWFNWMLQPEVRTTAGNQVEVEFDEELYRYYMDELGTKRVVLEAVPREIGRGITSRAPSEVAASQVRAYIKAVSDFFSKRGWFDRLVFNSPIDEPNTAEHYEQTRYWADLVHEVAPRVPFLVTESPVPDNPEWGELTGHANNFSVHGNRLNSPEVQKAIRKEADRGGEISWYISCDQVYPQPNYFIDAPAMDPVMIPWITHRHEMDGVLYWAVNFWTQTPDPWLDPVTYLSGFLCSEGWILSGEGSLVYPGNRVQRYTGQSNVEGPVSSIRLELLREGIEDYEYLWLLESAGDQDLAQEIVRDMVVDVSTFSRNVEQLFLSRERMARRLEELRKSGRLQ